jgi:serine protease
MARLPRITLGGVALAAAAALSSPIRVGGQSVAFGLPYATTLAPDMLAARLQALREHMRYVPGEALVRFKDGFELPDQLRALRALRGGVASDGMRWIGNTLLVHASSEPNAELMADVLARQPEVEWAEPNYLAHLHAVPNDTSYARQWNFGAINMPVAWDISHGGSTAVIVAVLDSGIETTTASFTFPLWNGTVFANATIPFAASPDQSPSRMTGARDFAFWTGPVLDMVGHGTHVAGTILQDTNNNLGFAGIAYNARLMPVKVCFGFWEIQIVQAALNMPGFADPDAGGCATSDLIAGIRYAADNGAKVLNLSLGGPGQSTAELEALRYAVSKGAFIAVSAGNSFEEGNPIEYPAGFGPQVDGVMSVAATGRSRRRAYYSSTGSYIEIAAPGGDFRDGGLSGVVYQTGLLTTDSEPTLVRVPRFDRYFEEPLQGTSMAAPHVAGVAALLYSQGITNPAAIEAAIKRSAVDLGTPGRDDEYGYGLIDARAALRGFGAAR